MNKEKKHETYTFREMRRSTALGGHIYEERWDCSIFDGGTPERLLDFWAEFLEVYEKAEWTEDMVYEKICCVLKGFPLKMIRNLRPQDQTPNIVENTLFESYAPESVVK